MVVAIIGIFVGVTVLSTDLVGRGRVFEQEARRLIAVLTFARDEALLQTRDLGIFVAEDGYHFFSYEYELGEWVPLAVRPFDPRRLDDDMMLALRIDDREVVLDRERDAIPPPPESEELYEEYLEDLPDPQIMILSSGEITPFQLEFQYRPDPFEPGTVLNFAFDGRWEIAQGEL